jgi:hypothetical protein
MCAPSRPGEVHRSSNAKHRPPPRASKRPTTSKAQPLNGLLDRSHPHLHKTRAIESHTLWDSSLQSVRPRHPWRSHIRQACRQKRESPKRECRYTQPWPLVPIGACIEVPLEHAHKFQSMPLPDGFGLAEVLVQNQPGPQGLSRPAQGCSRRVIVPCLRSARPAGQDCANYLVQKLPMQRICLTRVQKRKSQETRRALTQLCPKCGTDCTSALLTTESPPTGLGGANTRGAGCAPR